MGTFTSTERSIVFMTISFPRPSFFATQHRGPGHPPDHAPWPEGPPSRGPNAPGVLAGVPIGCVYVASNETGRAGFRNGAPGADNYVVRSWTQMEGRC